ncbi:MAG: RimK family alpha-L-glutamate ligase [Planctomycetales bacterium]|nr:RimK family alpha-L-glutamate ligase [Planctomycetales bacterium]
MHIAILANPDSWYARDLSRAATDRGHAVEVLPFRMLTAEVATGEAAVWGTGSPLSKSDAVIVRTMPPGSLEQVVFRMNLLAQLEAQGVQVLNPARAVECAVDKYLTTARLMAAGLPVPRTIVCETADAALAAFETLGRDVVVKPLFGSEGRGILRVTDPDLALRVFRTLERIQAVLYLQQFVDHDGSDLRVMVLDGRVLAAMKRRGADGDFRTNVSRSGQAEPVELTDEQRDWALRASAAVGTRVAGVDLLYDRRGRGHVIEVNGVPGWKALFRVTGCDVADEIIRNLETNS